ncbi:MAG TPA: hypothetical protein VI452_06190 [Marmoricola sp.]
MRVLVVDGANVVGSRPDGWWRDRAGAAARLHASIARAQLDFDEVLLVLEGKARDGAPAGRHGTLSTIHSPGAGDDTIVDEVGGRTRAGDDVTVVTADRRLRERVSAVGGAFVGPSWLLERTG